MTRIELEVGAATDVGRQRRRNEDRFAVHLGRPDEDDYAAVLLVADGMGGEKGGERASQMAVERLYEHLVTVQRTAGEPLSDVLRRLVRQTSDEIHRLGESDPDLRGLGSTLVAAVAEHGFLTVAHVGDSRCYRIRHGMIELLTIDHTWVGDQIAAGMLTQDEARHHPQRNVLTRSLGDAESPAVDVRTDRLGDGDLFVLCSDGLTAGLSDAEILEIAGRYPRPQDLADTLVAAANEKDGSDNVTVVVVCCRNSERRSEPDKTEPIVRPEELRRGKSLEPRKVGIFVSALMILVLLLAGAGFYGLRLHAERLYDEGLEHLRAGRLLHARESLGELFGLLLDDERAAEIVEALLESPPEERVEDDEPAQN